MRDHNNILTIIVEIKDKDAAKAIWDAMKDKDGQFLGCKPFCLAWGDMNDERDRYREVAAAAVQEHSFSTDRDFPDEVETECGKKFYQWPFNVYSTSQRGFDQGEWFSTYESLKKQYKVVKEDGVFTERQGADSSPG